MSLFSNLDAISKVSSGERYDLDLALIKIAEKLSSCLRLDRINVWLFEDSEEYIRCLKCIASYDARTAKFDSGERLLKTDLPHYFEHLSSDHILALENVKTDPICQELAFSYCTQHGIHSMLDVPLRISGELVGVICFEETNQIRHWTEEEKQFCMAVSQIVSLTIETHQRRLNEERLKESLKMNQILMGEIHHRIKNNLQLLISLLRIERSEQTNEETKIMLEDIERRMVSIVQLHEKLYSNGSFVEVSLCQYLTDLTNELGSSSPKVRIESNMPDRMNLEVPASIAVTIGLIVSEAVSNALKHAFDQQGGSIILSLQQKTPDDLAICITDNGKGFKGEIRSGFGLNLMEDLTTQLEGSMKVEQLADGGTSLEFRLPCSSLELGQDS